MRDYYEVLGVARNADADAIKKAYRKLALQYHPDRNGGDTASEEKFREATEAYEVLRDDQKRAAYDRFGHAGVQGGAGGQQGFGGFGFEDAINTFMRDFGGFGGGFEDLFGGGGRGGRRVQRGKDIRLRMKLTLEEVATGVKRTIKVRLLDPCAECEGSGAADGAEPTICRTCQGQGQVRRVRQSVFGQVMSATVCPACQGEGRTVENACAGCRGDGRQRVDRSIDVEIPPGVSSDNYLTLRGQGNVGPRGGPRGDIIVVMEVEEDPRFLREGDDLIYDLPLSFSQAALGTEVEVPTVYGPESVRIPGGVQSGEIIPLEGKGLPSLQGGGRGDQHLRIRVWTPVDLTPEQEAAFRGLRDVEGAPPELSARGRSGFWRKVREAFAV